MFRQRLTKYPEKVRPHLDSPTEAATLYVRTIRTARRELPGIDMQDMSDLSALHLGHSIVTRYLNLSGPIKKQIAIDGLVKPEKHRTEKLYNMDALIAATAIEVAYLGAVSESPVRFLCRQLLYPATANVVQLGRLVKREPYRSVATMAVTSARDTLIDEFVARDALTDLDTRHTCAQMIGSAIIGAQGALVDLPPAQDS